MGAHGSFLAGMIRCGWRLQSCAGPLRCHRCLFQSHPWWKVLSGLACIACSVKKVWGWRCRPKPITNPKASGIGIYACHSCNQHLVLQPTLAREMVASCIRARQSSHGPNIRSLKNLTRRTRSCHGACIATFGSAPFPTPARLIGTNRDASPMERGSEAAPSRNGP